MTRAHLLLLISALLPVKLGCDSGDDDQPDFAGTYDVEVTGRLGPVEWEAEELPDTIALDWPEELEIELLEYGDEEGQMCSDDACWYGNASATVNGARPDAAFVHVHRGRADLALVMADGFLVHPVAEGDCDYFLAYFLGLDLQVDGQRVEGSAGGPVECIITSDDAESRVLHQYTADLQLTLSGTRRSGSVGR